MARAIAAVVARGRGGGGGSTRAGPELRGALAMRSAWPPAAGGGPGRPGPDVWSRAGER